METKKTELVSNLYINGQWRASGDNVYQDVVCPATEAAIGKVAVATAADLDCALDAAKQGFAVWKRKPPLDRANVLHGAAQRLREHAARMAEAISREQGKPVAEAATEVQNCADIFDWYADEGRRAYGRVIPARQAGISQMVHMEPIGPVAAFSPWNFPASQAAKKIGASLAAGCSIIIKGPEEAPSGSAFLASALAEAGLPPGVLSLVFGKPSFISSHLIASPIIRKVSFTGSVPVGKHLAQLAGQHMKPCTLELGGHAPVLVFDDADAGNVALQLAKAKYRNSGQVCISPTRYYIQRSVYDEFAAKFTGYASSLVLGKGDQKTTQMGPLASERRLHEVQRLVDEAVKAGARVLTGGKRPAGPGYFFEPTVLADVPKTARIWQEEPFGPIALLDVFDSFEEAMEKANSTHYGLASYAYTQSAATAAKVSTEIEAGMLAINQFGFGVIEAPFGGIKDSGYGREGGIEGLSAYMVTKFVSHMTVV